MALRLVQAVVGYEWLVSGLTKLDHGDFPQGLAGRLRGMDAQAPGWFRGLLGAVVLPHTTAFGYGIEAAEVAVGAVLLAGLVVGPAWLRRLTLPALVVGTVLVASFALAKGSTFGLSLARDSFDEGVDLDTLLIGLQLALFVGALADVRRQEPISNSRRTSLSDIRSWLSSRQPTISGVGSP